MKRERVKQMFIKGFINENEMSKDFINISKELNNLEQEKNKFKEYLKQCEAQQNDEELFKDLLNKISLILDNDSNILSFKDKRFIVENLIEEITLKFDENREDVKVNIYGAIREIILSSISCDIESSSQRQEIINTKQGQNITKKYLISTWLRLKKFKGNTLEKWTKNK